jgi:hypothetical protein
MSRTRATFVGIVIAALVLGGVGLVLLEQGERHLASDREASRSEVDKHVQRRVEATKRRLASPRAKQERARSRTAYTDLGRSEVAELVRHKYPSTLHRLESGVRPRDVKHYTSDYTAIVNSGPGARAAGGSALAISSFPLRNVSASGKREPTDLTLRASDGGLEAVNPLADFKLPADLAEGIQLPGDIPLAVASGHPSGVAPSQVGPSTALYPEVDTDTDLLASSTPRGIELFRLMRSPSSPDAESLRLGLPQGASLGATEAGGAQVVRDGRTLLAIAPPTAVDAQHRGVPVTMQVVDDTLRVSVARGDRDWAYPILVDPAIDSYSHSDFHGWYGFNYAYPGASPQSGNYSLSGDCMFGRSCMGQGLNIYAWQGQWYYGGAYAGFGYRAPSDRPSAFIARASLGLVGYYSAEGTPSSPYMYMGLWDSANGQNNWQAFYMSWGYGNVDLNRLGDSPSVDEVDVQLNNIFDHAAVGEHHAYVGAVTIYLDDNDGNYPAFGVPKRPPWVDQQPATIPLTVNDPGLGIAGLTVSKSGGPSWQTSVGCAGGNRSPCPVSWSSPANGEINYDPSALPQGVNNLTVTATDAAGHVSPNPATAQVRVDHTAPSLELSGPLVEAAQSEGGGP